MPHIELICRNKNEWHTNPVWMFTDLFGNSWFIFAQVMDDDGFYELRMIDQEQFDLMFDVIDIME